MLEETRINWSFSLKNMKQHFRDLTIIYKYLCCFRLFIYGREEIYKTRFKMSYYPSIFVDRRMLFSKKNANLDLTLLDCSRCWNVYNSIIYKLEFLIENKENISSIFWKTCTYLCSFRLFTYVWEENYKITKK